ncbi:MAG: hypothetical protein LIP09_05320 [Bacteroidales bacterium]|nr:hypothetical protein [Bacteroidales bacterium]
MKKRLRKKLHVAEYAQYGIMVGVKPGESPGNKITGIIIDVADKHGIAAWGGGGGFFIMPHMDPNYEIPTFVSQMSMAIAIEHSDNDSMIFCLFDPKSQSVDGPVANAVRDALAGYDFKINPRISLWHKI